MSFRNVFGAAFLVVAAAATWLWSRPPAPAPLSAAVESVPLGYYLRGARLVGSDEDGHITYTVTADQASEVPGEDALALEGVRVQYMPQAEVSWVVTAAHATIPADGAYLTLTGNVELRNQPADGREPTVVATEALLFTPDRFSAESSTAVEVTIGDDVVRAVGLKARLKEDSLQLESEVHGRFVP
jgi:LPS export ABC transporter protein LptC